MFPLSQTMSCTRPSPMPLSFPLLQQPVLDSFDMLHFRKQLRNVARDSQAQAGNLCYLGHLEEELSSNLNFRKLSFINKLTHAHF